MFLLNSYKKNPDLSRLETEKYYFDPDADSSCLFPSLNDEASVDLSIIAPSYNEEERCKTFFDFFFCYLHLLFTYCSLPYYGYNFVCIYAKAI